MKKRQKSWFANKSTLATSLIGDTKVGKVKLPVWEVIRTSKGTIRAGFSMLPHFFNYFEISIVC